MAKKTEKKPLKRGVSQFTIIGKAKVGDTTFEIDTESQKSDWISSTMKLGIDVGNGVVYTKLWGGYGATRDNVIYVNGIKKDEKGKWVPYSDRVIPTADNVDFYFAPIYTDYSKGLLDAENATVYANLLKWMDFLEGRKNEFLLYTYDTNFHHFMYNFNNFDTFTEQAKVYAACGVDFIHSQGANGTNQPCFQEMRYFVESQILWDTSKNYDALVDEFMTHFYKDASAEIREYYDLTRLRYEQASILNDKSYTDDIYSNIGDKEIWTEGVVDAIDKIFKRAYQKIEHYKIDDPDMYSKLLNRIKELELTLTYTKLKYYSINYTQNEVNALVDEFNYYALKFDINSIKEGGEPTVGYFDNLKK